MKVILIDDEQMALDLLGILLEKIGGIDVVGTYTDSEKAFLDLQHTTVDLVFLDIEMGSIHGLDFAERLLTTHPHLEVIFVTAHPQYALEAFEVNAIDYLLKPVTMKRLNKSLDRLQGRLIQYKQSKELVDQAKGSFFIQSMGAFRLFDPERNEVKWRTRKVKELFIYLWHHREKATHRTRVMEDLWQGLPKDKMVTLMHTTVYQLRKTLKQAGIENPVKTINEQYALNIEIKSDVEELYEAWNQVVEPALVQRVMDLYKGDYLEAENYSWALYEQQRMKEQYLKFLEVFILEASAEPAHYQIIGSCLEEAIVLEPYSEKYMAMLLDYYGKNKKTKKVVMHFQEFKKKWVEDLGIEPPSEVVEIYKKYIEM